MTLNQQLDPDVAALLVEVAAQNAPPTSSRTPQEARADLLASAQTLGADPPAIARVEERTLPGPAGALAARLYRPQSDGPLPLMVYYHGGGWVLGDLETHDGFCRTLAVETPCVVLSVDYRLAPEDPYPAAPEDCYAALLWAAEHVVELGGRADQILVGGDSAGGNLAAVTALLARDRGGPTLAGQLLLYPVTDMAHVETESYRSFAEGYFLTRDSMLWFRDHYLPNPADWTQPEASPLLASDLAGLPPAIVITAGFDPLRDEGNDYAARLTAAQVSVRHTCYDNLIHGFYIMMGRIPAARRAMSDTIGHLQALLKN